MQIVRDSSHAIDKRPEKLDVCHQIFCRPEIGKRQDLSGLVDLTGLQFSVDASLATATAVGATVGQLVLM
jgi:hypothetical protein